MSDLWTCPRCGVKLVQKNLSHACGDFSIEKFLAGKPRDLFDRFVAMIAACGPYDVAPAKTRVAFLVRVRFASVNRVSKDSIDVHLVLPRKIASKRFRRIEKLGNLYVHHLKLFEHDFDAELRSWIRAARTEYGMGAARTAKARRPRKRS